MFHSRENGLDRGAAGGGEKEQTQDYRVDMTERGEGLDTEYQGKRQVEDDCKAFGPKNCEAGGATA